MYVLKGNNVNFGYFYCVRVQVIFFHNIRNGTAKRLVKSMYITTGVSGFYSNVLKSAKKLFSGLRDEILMRSAKCLGINTCRMLRKMLQTCENEC